jgi:hypothetical protein
LAGTQWDFPKSFMLDGSEIDLTLSFNSMNKIKAKATICNRSRWLSGMYWECGKTIFCIVSSEDDKSKGISKANKWDQTVINAILKSKNPFIYRLHFSQKTLIIDGMELTQK